MTKAELVAAMKDVPDDVEVLIETHYENFCLVDAKYVKSRVILHDN